MIMSVIVYSSYSVSIRIGIDFSTGPAATPQKERERERERERIKRWREDTSMRACTAPSSSSSTSSLQRASSSCSSPRLALKHVWFTHASTRAASRRQRQRRRQGRKQDAIGDTTDTEEHDEDAANFVLRDVNLEIQPGEVALLTGRSGSGKSTLLSLAARFITPTRGDVVTNTNTTTGVVFQFPERHFVAETLAAEIAFGMMPGAEAELARIVDAMRLMGMDVNALATQKGRDMRLRDLSGGYQRRLAIAVQVARQPGLLLMDEPLAGLDWKTKESLVPALRNLADRNTATDGDGCGVLIVSHETDELRDVVDSWWELRDGRVTRVHPS